MQAVIFRGFRLVLSKLSSLIHNKPIYYTMWVFKSQERLIVSNLPFFRSILIKNNKPREQLLSGPSCDNFFLIWEDFHRFLPPACSF